MKVAFATAIPHSVIFGGREVQLLATAKHLRNQGFDVVLLSNYDKGSLDGVELVHFFGIDPAFVQSAQILSMRGLPYVVSPVFYVVDNPIGRNLRSILRFIPHTVKHLLHGFVRGASALLPNSAAEAHQLATYWGVKDRVFVIPNGIDAGAFGSSEGFRSKYLKDFIASDVEFVLSVGRIDERKNTLMLVRAALEANLPLVLFGSAIPPTSKERKYVSTVMEMVKSYPDRLHHIPPINSESQALKDAYAAARVHALVSHLETPGLASLEAGSLGCNLVVGDCPPVREYFGTIANLVRQDDLHGIARALQDEMEYPRDYRHQSLFIRENYSWNHVATLTSEVYRKVLSK